MRYYAIKIDGAPAPFQPVPGALIPGAQWCSIINGRHDPSAQQVEFSLEPISAHEGSPSCTVTIRGIPFSQITQYADIRRLPVSIYGGMSPGLPLATHQSQYAGLLISGTIIRSWAHWDGKDQSLSFAIQPGQVGPANNLAQKIASTAAGALAAVGSGASVIGDTMAFLFGGGGTIASPLNLIHNLMPNTPLDTAVRQTLSTAFPGSALKIAISPQLQLPSQDAGAYQSLPQYAQYLKQISQGILGTDRYQGIHVSSHGPSIDVWDDTVSLYGGATQIQFADLIGQPTWIGSTDGGNVATISFMTVMRSDIYVGSHVILPPTLMTVSEAGFLANADTAKSGVLAFQGEFTIQHVLHTGDLRQPDGHAWSTTYEAVKPLSSAAPGPVIPFLYGFPQPVGSPTPSTSTPPPPVTGPSMISRSLPRRYA